MALFETPHLNNISHPETLTYRYEQTSPQRLTDSVSLHVTKIHPDGTKYVSFEFMTGERRIFFPAVDHFSGNPLLMLFLEHDVREMKDQTGIAAAYFRNRIREAFVDRAILSDSSVQWDGRAVGARLISLKPFADDPRLQKLPSFRGKQYSFLLSDRVPGQIEQLEAEMPADPESGTPEWSEKITFVGEGPQ